MFGTAQAPVLDYTVGQIADMAKGIIESRISVTGVQAKLSLDSEKGNKNSQYGVGEPLTFTIVGVMGRYILKPPVAHFQFLPEVEDLTMHLAELAGIATVPHSVIRLKDGSLAYITRRIDRINGKNCTWKICASLPGALPKINTKGLMSR